MYALQFIYLFSFIDLFYSPYLAFYNYTIVVDIDCC